MSAEYVPVAQNDVDLDRTHINAAGQIALVNDSSNKSIIETPGGSSNREQDSSPLNKRKYLFKKATKAVKAIHNGGKSSRIQVVPTAPVLADAKDITTNTIRLVHDLPEPKKTTVKEKLKNPIDTTKSAVAGQGGHEAVSKLLAKEVSHGQEAELVKAHDKVMNASSAALKLLAIKELGVLMKARQDQYVRWTMDRHITKVRLRPKGTVERKEKGDFVVLTKEGKEKLDWEGYAGYLARYYAEQYGGEYIGYTSDPPAPTKETLIPSVERLLIASAPLQQLAMAFRRVYRWDDRNETLKYVAAYFGLWITDMIVPGILLSIIYLIVNRKLRAPTIEDMRKDIMRIEDATETAMTLTEFVEKRGDEAWVNSMIEQLGPWLFIQLADTANMMEILRNFYEWRVPSRTAVTVGLLTVGFFAVTFTPIWLLVRSITLIIGIVFFALFPISSRFQDYRLLASPFVWIFWKIPTHAEWSIKSLQAEGARYRKLELQPPDPTSDQHKKQEPDPLGYRGPPTGATEAGPAHTKLKPTTAEVRDYGSYHCKFDNHSGKLLLNSEGLRFQSSIGHHEKWFLKYMDIKRIEKITRQTKRALSGESGQDLMVAGPGDEQYLLLDMAERDQAFSQIVGFADVTWQVVW